MEKAEKLRILAVIIAFSWMSFIIGVLLSDSILPQSTSEIPALKIQSGVVWLNESEYQNVWAQTWNTSRTFVSDRNYFGFIMEIKAILPSIETIDETKYQCHSYLTVNIKLRNRTLFWHASNVTIEGFVIYRSWTNDQLFWLPSYGDFDITYESLDFVWIVFAGYCNAISPFWITVFDVQVSAGIMWPEAIT